MDFPGVCFCESCMTPQHGSLVSAQPRGKIAKVFCFFFSKKKDFLA